MARRQTVILDKATLRLVAALATVVASNIMVQLLNRGTLDDDDLESILGHTAAGGLGDPSLDTAAKMMAETMRAQIAARMN